MRKASLTPILHDVLGREGLVAVRAGQTAELLAPPEAWHADEVRGTPARAPRLFPVARPPEPRLHPKKVAVVTGASRGMGFEACRQLGKQGFTVILTSRELKSGKAAAARLREEGLDVIYQRLDVTVPRSANALAGFLKHTYGRVDVLVNNAGALYEALDEIDSPKARGLLGTRLETIQKSLATNTLGPINVARALVPLMRERESGRIINISSRLGAFHEMGVGAPAYRMSKASLNAVTCMLSQELKDTGIKVNAVDPGWVRTDMGGPNAPLSPIEGVDTTLWLATVPDEDAPTGGFYRERQKIDW